MFKSYMKSLLLVTALFFGSLKPVQIGKNNLFVPNKLGKIKVFHDKKGFSIKKDGEIHRVENCFVDKEIVNLTSKQLMQFLGEIKVVEVHGQKVEFERISEKQFEKIFRAEGSEKIELDEKEVKQLFEALNSSSTGYISVSQTDDGEYVLRAQYRILGGGIALGMYIYWGVKGLCYGSIATVVISTGGAAAAGAGAAAGALGAAAAGTAAGAGAAVTAGAAAGGLGVAAAEGFAINAGIEGLALFLGGLAGFAPTP